MAQKQATIPGTDTTLSRAADLYVDILEEQQEFTERKIKASRELIELMRANGKNSLRHKGRTLLIEEVEATVKLKVQKVAPAPGSVAK